MQTTYHVAPAVPGGGLSETFTMMSLGFQLSRTKSNLESYNKRAEFSRKERTSGLYGDPQPQVLHKATPRECFYGPCSNTLARRQRPNLRSRSTSLLMMHARQSPRSEAVMHISCMVPFKAQDRGARTVTPPTCEAHTRQTGECCGWTIALVVQPVSSRRRV
jgi:hypothetical protein